MKPGGREASVVLVTSHEWASGTCQQGLTVAEESPE